MYAAITGTGKIKSVYIMQSFPQGKRQDFVPRSSQTGPS